MEVISRGSEWHRWEPHIHAPGTILNNQFGASDPWNSYLTTLEGLAPEVEAVAVTDYYVTDTYEEFLKHKAAGRLPGVSLLFPNIELRLDVAAKTGFVNVHLLVSPEDPEHLSEVKRILKRLQFHAFNDRFDCTREELIKLGKRADSTITDDGAALRHGATQFKVNFDQLRKVIEESEWAKKNILIAVAGGASDGTSGVRQAADATMRQEIEKLPTSSSQAAQRSGNSGSAGEALVPKNCARAMTDASRVSMAAIRTTRGPWGSPSPIASRGLKARWSLTPCGRPASIRRAGPMSARSRQARPCRRRSSRMCRSSTRIG